MDCKVGKSIATKGEAQHDRSWGQNFFRIASLVMVLVATSLVAALVTMHFAFSGAEVQIPTLKGMTVADARSQTSGLGAESGRG